MGYDFQLVVPPLQDWAALPQRQLSKIDTVMFHRIGPQLDGKMLLDAESIAAWFKLHGPAEISSPNMPYSFIIPYAAPKVYQAVPLKVRTPHAKSWNTRAVSVAVVGDFRKDTPSAFQTEAARWVALRIQDYLGRRLTIAGHTWVPESTGWVGHDCPGAKFLPTFDGVTKYVSDSMMLTA